MSVTLRKRKLKPYEWLLLYFDFSPEAIEYTLQKGLPIPERQLTWRKLLYIRDGLKSGKRTVGISLKDLKRIYGSGLNPTVYSKYSWLVYHDLRFEEPSPPENPRNRRKPTPEQISKAKTEIPWETRVLRVRRLARLFTSLASLGFYPNYGKKHRKPS